MRHAWLAAWGNDLQQQLVAARLHGVVQRAQLRFLLEPMLDGIVGMELHQALDDVLLRPGDQRRADRATAIELERI